MRKCSITFLLVFILYLGLFIAFQEIEILALKDANRKWLSIAITLSKEMDYLYNKSHRSM